MTRKVILILLPIIMIGCSKQVSDKLTDSEKNSIIMELQPCITQLIDNREHDNIEKIMEPYLNSPEFLCVSNGVISNYDDFKKSNEEYYAYLESQEHENSDLSYNVLDKDIVIVTWNTSTKIIMQGGQGYEINPYTASFILKKLNDKWKVIYAHGSGSMVATNN